MIDHIIEYPSNGGEKHTFRKDSWTIILSKLPEKDPDSENDAVISAFKDKQTMLQDVCVFDHAMKTIVEFLEKEL